MSFTRRKPLIGRASLDLGKIDVSSKGRLDLWTLFEVSVTADRRFWLPVVTSRSDGRRYDCLKQFVGLIVNGCFLLYTWIYWDCLRDLFKSIQEGPPRGQNRCFISRFSSDRGEVEASEKNLGFT